MLAFAVWLLFIGNYMILYASMHLNFYFKNIMFYLYLVIALIFNLIIFSKPKRIRININSINSIVVGTFIISIIISILVTFQSGSKEGLVKLLYILLCIIYMIDAYILGTNHDILSINSKIMNFTFVLSVVIMTSIMLYDILVLQVFRIASDSNAIGTSRALATGLLFIFSLYFYKKKYFKSFLFYLVGIFLSFLSGTRQVFVSYLPFFFLFSIIPYFDRKSLFSLKNIFKNFLILCLIIIVVFSIYTNIDLGELSEKNYSYINVLLFRYGGGQKDEYRSLNIRVDLISAGIDIIYDQPIFGKFHYNEQLRNPVHQMHIDLCATFGIFPLLLFLLINFIIITKFSAKQMSNDFFYFFLFMLFIFYSIPSLFVTTFLVHPFYYFVIFYLFGLKKRNVQISPSY